MRLIDADALKEYITKAYEEMKSEFKTDKYRDMAKLITESFCMDIDEAPTIDPVRHGHWIYQNYVWCCSECGKNPTVGMGYVQGQSELYLYCPNCGAKMGGGEDDE